MQVKMVGVSVCVCEREGEKNENIKGLKRKRQYKEKVLNILRI